MKPNDPWQKLVAAARAHSESEAQAPLGFSTRVVARAELGGKNRPLFGSAFARFSWPALGVAALTAIIAVATNLKPVMNSLSDDVAALSDPVSDADTSA
ncbi:MAG TPA: hypothetical protein VIM69_12065 [Opitutaceae bacterium]